MSFQENNINIVVLADIIVFIGFIVGMRPLHYTISLLSTRRHGASDPAAESVKKTTFPIEDNIFDGRHFFLSPRVHPLEMRSSRTDG